MSSKKKTKKEPAAYIRPGSAKAHGELANDSVHVFVDDQNLFWGVLNSGQSRGYRVDFGRLLTAASRDASGKTRFVKSAYIAGVIPDDDSFWKIAENQGFTVRRGYLSGAGGGSVQSRTTLISSPRSHQRSTSTKVHPRLYWLPAMLTTCRHSLEQMKRDGALRLPSLTVACHPRLTRFPTCSAQSTFRLFSICPLAAAGNEI